MPSLKQIQERESALILKTANLWVTEDEWAQLKSEAALQHMQLREYIEMILRERKKG